jgi:hypothetical protein
MLPDINLTHTKTVKKLEKTERVFTTKNGVRRKWIVRFEDGYTAEVTPLDGDTPAEFADGTIVTFRIGYRTAKGDEIEAVRIPETAPQDSGKEHQTMARIISMHGHPSVIALSVAKDVQIARLEQGQIKAIRTGQLLKDADEIVKWLTNKLN